MKNLKFVLTLIVVLGILSISNSYAQESRSYTVEYYYKVKWGHFDEFLELYKKNHYPILEELRKRGEILEMSAAYPLNHQSESARWDFRFTITFRDFDAAHNSDTDQEIIKQLYPDRETFKKEEQRRFAILLEHRDVPLEIESFEGW